MLAGTAEVERIVSSAVDGPALVMEEGIAPGRAEVTERPMAAARGIVIGVLISTVIWIGLAFVVYMLR